MPKHLPRLLVLGLILSLLPCIPGQDKSASDQPSPGEIVDSALKSDANYRQALMAMGDVNLGEMYPSGEYDIPPEYWTEPIKALKPVKVYDHLLNVVIVLSVKDGLEDGIYVANTLSSYMPFLGGVQKDGFEFSIDTLPEEKPFYIPPMYHFRRSAQAVEGKSASDQEVSYPAVGRGILSCSKDQGKPGERKSCFINLIPDTLDLEGVKKVICEAICKGKLADYRNLSIQVRYGDLGNDTRGSATYTWTGILRFGVLQLLNVQKESQMSSEGFNHKKQCSCEPDKETKRILPLVLLP